MKRSRINRAIREMEELMEQCGFKVPPFCAWTPREWKSKGEEYREIRENRLGWDITDYGLGNFDQVGFALITLRNGNAGQKERYPKPVSYTHLQSAPGIFPPEIPAS